ncbi:archaeal gamma-glutamyl kinase [Cenarchaeum symbiosum A]|uniref:Isopentenyl phosphate kinase n=1 Tax=Cenarchaeum symbiosum (strain A) TaxID=414004 RepID=A0RY17_CENSY|nr:archaeal gamma-glutamyl kinase [Cenarchaeum symbiosum A]
MVKLGGSVITNKEKPLSARTRNMDGIAAALAKLREPVVVVHGGGSFGHYWSVKYDMHTKPARYEIRGVATVKNSMARLNMMVLDSLLNAGLSPYSVPPACISRSGRPLSAGIKETGEEARAGLVPVTYGDALWAGRGRTYILSGDRIMGMLARALRPRLCIFAMNVDGLYESPRTRKLIPELGRGTPELGEAGMDVTGGMGRKIEEGRKIARGGTKVFLVNGKKPRRILDAALKGSFAGTIIRGHK